MSYSEQKRFLIALGDNRLQNINCIVRLSEKVNQKEGDGKK